MKNIKKIIRKLKERKRIGTQAKWIGLGVAICIIASACLIKPAANVGTKAAADTIGAVASLPFHTRDSSEVIANEEKATDVTDETSDSNSVSTKTSVHGTSTNILDDLFTSYNDTLSDMGETVASLNE